MPRNQMIYRRATSLLLASVLVVLSSASCAVSTTRRIAANRDTISREIPLVVEYETHRNETKKAIGFLVINRLFDLDSDRQVKEAMNIEYVYYEAAVISLAHGNFDDYRNFLNLAEQELSRVMTVLTARVQALQSDRAS